MCRRITCNKCEKFTWTGCGLHIQSALAGLTEEEKCQCNKQEEASESKGATNNGNSILSKLKYAIGM